MNSALSDAYESYRSETGMFWPRLNKKKIKLLVPGFRKHMVMALYDELRVAKSHS